MPYQELPHRVPDDAQKVIVKQALSDAGHVVELAAERSGDQLVLALKGTSGGTFIASEITTLKDATLTAPRRWSRSSRRRSLPPSRC